MLWLIAANPNKYDIDAAFDELQFIDWTKNANYKKNDIIFIYVSNPVQRIKYICKVINDNVNEDEAIDDKKYWLNSSDFNKNSNDHVRLELKKRLSLILVLMIYVLMVLMEIFKVPVNYLIVQIICIIGLAILLIRQICMKLKKTLKTAKILY